MSGFFLGLLNLINEIKNYVYIMVAFALLCVAIGGLLGGEETRGKIKQNILWIALCAGIAIGCVQLAQWAVGNFTF